ncbi:MAG: aminoacyl-tRNA hydrolase [Eubacteriales bacterium]|nr:aminoacyl-tRNA hydrolase [Eubacteriales bacterium]
MYLIVGLGNPGAKYDRTKHNMGFDTITELVDRHNIPNGGTDMKGMYGKGYIGGQKVILLKPLTYMNLSGECVQAYLNYYKIDPETELIVIYDDIDLEPGQLRVRKKGRAGGHNGMKNIIQHIGTDAFARIRVGIGAKPEKWDLADYVLAPFGKEERVLADQGISSAADAVEMILAGEIDGAMNRFNKKKEKKKAEAKPEAAE